MTTTTSKLRVLFAILTLACATGCAAESGSDDEAEAPAETQAAPAPTVDMNDSTDAPAAPSRPLPLKHYEKPADPPACHPTQGGC